MNSIWADTQTIPPFPTLEQNHKTDVLIIGGGMTGILCAYLLAQAGINYILVEADRICRGISRNTTAKITSQHGLVYHKLLHRFGAEKARIYLEANEDALNRFRQLCTEIDCDFEERDNFVYSVDRPDKIDKELAALGALGYPAEFAGKLPLPFSVAGAVKFSKQAQFHPLKFVSAISQTLNIREQTKVLAYDGRSVVTDRGTITADKIIVTTHFPMFNKHGSYFLKLYQHRSYVLAVDGGPDIDGMYVDEAGDGFSFRNYGHLLLLGGGGHRTGKPSSGWTEPTALSQLHYPGAKEVCRWATQDCMTLDGVPYIGQYSKRTPNLYVATGFNKWGMTSSMVAADLLCNMVQGKDSAYAPVFSPSRTILRPQLAINGLETTANLLTPTRPRCPHMGCALKWNPQERSWDCSCHGSRFDENGTLLDNPATSHLRQSNADSTKH